VLGGGKRREGVSGASGNKCNGMMWGAAVVEHGGEKHGE